MIETNRRRFLTGLFCAPSDHSYYKSNAPSLNAADYSCSLLHANESTHREMANDKLRGFA